MRTRFWCTTLVLASLGLACSDQPTEVVVDREVSQEAGMAAGPRVIAAATTTTEDGLSISTDKDDYAPGDTVWFTGSGWPADDVLDILLSEQPETHPPHEWTVAVAGDGTFRDSTYVVDDGDLDVTFTLLATSRETGRSLTVMFTDGNLQFQPNPTPDPFSPNADGTKDATLITYRNQGSGTENNIQITIRPGATLASAPVRTFGTFNLTQNTSGTVTWDGTNTSGTVVAEGEYGLRVFNLTQTEATASGQRLYIALVDVTPPVISLPALSPASVTQGASTAVTVTGRATDNAAAGVAINRYQPTAAQYRIDAGAFANMTLTNTSPNVANARNLTATISGATVAELPAGDHLVCMRATDTPGNTSSIAITGNPNCATLQVISPDNQAPTIDCSIPSLTSWYATDVTVSCTATDASGLEDPANDAAFSLSTNVPANTETSTASTGANEVCDVHDNCATAGPFVFKVDKKAPAISCDAADGNWHAADVSIACTASDGGSGLSVPAEASFSLSTSVPAGTETSTAQTGTKTIADAVGNSATAGPVGGNKVDKKAPEVACGVADGIWHATDVSIACTATDGGSGLAGASPFNLHTDVPDGTETANASTNSQNVLDAVGNSTAAGPVSGNKVDKKAPQIACGAADNSWHADDVSIACTASDGGSGLANAGDAAFNLVTNVAANTETSNAATNSRNVPDGVGNNSTAGPIAGNKIDKKGPTVSLTCPASPLLLNAPASASWEATDGGSGVAAGYEDGSFAVPTNSVGPKTAVAAAGISQDDVGNPSSASPPCGYAVQFGFSGFRTPVDNNGVRNAANSGQAIPLKWELHDYAGNPVTTLAGVTVTVATLVCDAGTTLDLIEEYAAGSSGLQNHGNGSYQFNWKTPTSYARSCKTMKLDLGEGIVRTALFEFKK
jgi:hypothetical protein